MGFERENSCGLMGNLTIGIQLWSFGSPSYFAFRFLAFLLVLSSSFFKPAITGFFCEYYFRIW